MVIDPAPRVVTLSLAGAAQARLDALREAFFPPRSYSLPAHLTLLHAVPGDHEPLLAREVATLCAARSPFHVSLAGLIFLGHGFAIAAAAPPLAGLRRRLQRALWPHLGAQDRADFRPHITLANKLPAAAARARMGEAQAVWAPCRVEALGLSVWTYRGGPWDDERRVPFTGSSAPEAATPPSRP